MGRTKPTFKKRKFHGNRFKAVYPQQLGLSQNEQEPNPEPLPSTAHEGVAPRPTPTSASRKKLGLVNSYRNYSDFKGVSRNIVIGFDILVNLFQTVACKDCGGNVTLQEESSERNGLACKLCVTCLSCNNNIYFWSSEKCNEPNNDLFDSNVRLFYGLRCIGKGLEAGKMLCAMMNLPPPNTARGKYTDILSETIQNVAEESMIAATMEAVSENDCNHKTDITIAFDGSWQKRGFKSKNGFASITSLDTGKVIDTEVLTKHCDGCFKVRNKSDEIKALHKKNCVKNYDGASGGMESVAAVTMFSRSEEKRGVRYAQFLGDGDSKAFLSVTEANPYNDLEIKKLECVGHVEKRMGTRLRNLRIKLKGTVLSDGKPLHGHGRLTDKKIDQLQQYYGNAIRGNQDNLEGMRRSVWASYCHVGSTDIDPQHKLCPEPPNTWCKYRKAEHEGTLTAFKHKNTLPKVIMEAIRPVYRDLVNPSLLRKCLHGKTQNVNESFNNVVWTRIPKGTFVGKKTLELGVWDSVLTFNDGNTGRIRALKKLGLKDLGKYTLEGLQKSDVERLKKADKAAEEMTKEARIKKRRHSLAEEEKNNDYYCPGGF